MWDADDIQEHDEMMTELQTCSDGELVALLEDEDCCCQETHGFALAGVHPEEIQTEIDRRLKLSLKFCDCAEPEPIFAFVDLHGKLYQVEDQICRVCQNPIPGTRLIDKSWN
jgi:hypothetical protein